MQLHFLTLSSMKSVSIVLLSLLCLSACQQEGKLSTSTPAEELPVIGETETKDTLPLEKTDTLRATEDAPTDKAPTSPSKVTEPASEEGVAPIAKTTFTVAEVAQHATESDCWLILSGKAYEVTEFIPSHPGGKAILK